MSRIGPFADDDAAAWVTKSPDIGVAMAVTIAGLMLGRDPDDTEDEHYIEMAQTLTPAAGSAK